MADWARFDKDNITNIIISSDALLAAIATLVAGLVAVRFLSWCIAMWKERRLGQTVPKIRGGWPVLGHALKLARGAPWDVMTQWVREYGTVYRFSLFGQNNVVLSDPAYMKEVMRSKMSMYHKDVNFTYRPFLPLLGTGIVTSDGQSWRQQRNKVSAAFRIDVLSEVPGMAQRAVARLSKRLDAAAASGTAIEIGEEMRLLTLQVISEALMSLSAEEADGTFAVVYMPLVVEGHKRIWNPLRRFGIFLPAWWAHRRNERVLNDYITGIIRRRWDTLQRGRSNGLGDAARDIRRPLSNGGNGISKSAASGPKLDILDKVLASIEPHEWGHGTLLQIRDEMKTFVLAGHETSASMLTWALYELTVNQDLTDKVLTESEGVFGAGKSLTGPLPSIESLRDLKLTEACLREALRKYTLVPVVVRRSIADTIICGSNGEEHFIPQGTAVHLLIKGVHERADIWPEPLQYKPSRFYEAPKPYTFLAFIDGPRNCLGQHLSLLESKVVLSLLLNRYEFSLVNSNASELNPWIIPTISQHGTFLKIAKRFAG